jgi:hypothetical protein
MMLSRAVLLMAVAVVAWGVGHPAAAQTGDKYTARLGWVPIAGPNDRANISGKGSVTATLTGTRLTLSGMFEGLPAPATVARLHRGIAKGARGPVITDLTVTKAATGNAGTLAGTATLTPLDVDNLKAGKLYVQVHSEKGLPKEDGSTLWGWLLR